MPSLEIDHHTMLMQAIHPRVTICLLIWRYDDTVEAAIQSLLLQTYSHYNIIIHTVAPSNEYSAMIDTYRTYPLIHISQYDVHEDKNQIWNSAYKLATGDFIVFAYQDYPLLPTCLQSLIRPTQWYDTPVDLVYGNMICDINDKKTESLSSPTSLSYSGRHEFGYFLSLTTEYDLSCPILFRRSTLEKIGGFSERLGVASLYEVILRFSLNTIPIAHVPEIMLFPKNTIERRDSHKEFLLQFYPKYLEILRSYLNEGNLSMISGFMQRTIEAMKRASSYCMEYPPDQLIDIDQILKLQMTSHQSTDPKIYHQPNVSVITVCDSMNDLQQSLDTLEKQKYHDWELIIMQKGNSSFAGLAQYRSLCGIIRYIHVPYTHESECWQQAHNLVNGKHITYLESNAEWHPHHLEVMVSLSSKPGISIVLAKTEVIDNDHIVKETSWIERSSIMLHLELIDMGLWRRGHAQTSTTWLEEQGQLLNFAARHNLLIAYAPSMNVGGYSS